MQEAQVATLASRAERLYIVVGLFSCAASALCARWIGVMPLILVVISGPLVLLAGIVGRLPKVAWQYVLLLGLLAVLSARIVWMIWAGGPEPPGPSVGDMFALTSALLLILTLVVMTPGGVRFDRNTLYDAVIVAFGVALLWWGLVADPILGRERLDLIGTGMTAIFPLIAITQVLLTIRLATRVAPSHEKRVVLGFALAAIATILDGAFFAHQVTNDLRIIPLAVWAASLTLLGSTGFSHLGTPLTPAPGPVRRPITASRTILFAGLTAIPPVVLVVRWIVRPPNIIESNSNGALVVSVHLIVPVLLSTLLAVLLVVRTGSLANRLHVSSATLRDALAAREELQAELERRASHDPLTGLANRGVFEERLASALSASHRNMPEALLLVDLDGFKLINDCHGHPTGDRLLQAVANRLAKATPVDGIACRLGGDEFAILLPGLQPPEVVGRAELLLDQLRRPYTLGGPETSVTASIGILPLRRGLSERQALIDADVALYTAKARGKNNVVVFDERLRVRWPAEVPLQHRAG